MVKQETQMYLKVFHSGYNLPIYDNFEDLELDQLELLFLQLHILSNLIVVFHVPSILELFMALHHVIPVRDPRTVWSAENIGHVMF